MIPETRYALSGDISIAYQVIGEGSRDLVFVPGLISYVEFFHELPGYSEFLDGGRAHSLPARNQDQEAFAKAPERRASTTSADRGNRAARQRVEAAEAEPLLSLIRRPHDTR